MAKHRTHSMAFKRQVVQEYLAGETLHGLARRHDLSRNLIRIWVDKYEAGAFDEDAEAANTIQEYEGPDRSPRTPGRQAGPGDRVPKGGAAARTAAGKRAHVRRHRPAGLSIAQGCRLMGIARSTYYRAPKGSADDTALIEAMHAIQGRVRGLWLAPHAGGPQASRLDRKPQEDQTPDARACLASAAQAPLRRHHRQRSRRAHLPGPLQGPRGRWPEPALGRRPDHHRNPRRLRLSGGDHGCVVAPHHRLCARPADRRAADPCRASSTATTRGAYTRPSAT